MSQRPPRASTKGGDGKRPKTRGGTHADRTRAQSIDIQILSTDGFEKIGDDEVVEETALPEIPQLQLLVHDGPPHLAAARGAIAVAGHLIVAGGSGREDIDRLRPLVAKVDAILVGIPGGEPLIDAALALSPRPVIIASCTGNAVDATRRAAAAGADLVTLRPHDTERHAPILLAAARLVEHQRRPAEIVAPPPPAPEAPAGIGFTDELASLDALDALDDDADEGGSALQPYEVFESIMESELERAAQEASPISLALFAVEVDPEPPVGVRGILRARAGNALVQAIGDLGVATELDDERFLVLLPYADRSGAAEVARKIITAVGACDPVIAAGQAYPAKLVGAVTGANANDVTSFANLLHDATVLLDQARVTGASLAVEP